MPIVDNAVYVDGKRAGSPPSLDQTFETMAGSGGMGWIGLYRPSHDEVAAVADEFGLHQLVVDDTIAAHQRPKLEHYDGVQFVVVHPARYEQADDRVEFGELHVVVGPNFVVTSRFSETPDLAAVRARMEQSPHLLRLGPEAVLYAILDQVVDEYAPVADGLAEDIDAIELDVFGGEPAAPQRVYLLLREVIAFQRATQPLPAILDALTTGDGHSSPGHTANGHDEVRRHLRDVHDHVLRVIERVNGFRVLLESLLTVNASLISQRQSEDMRELTQAQYAQSEEVKKISGWAAILFAPTLVASVYGMNFKHMPELSWVLGYPMAIGLMVAGSLGLYLVFKRRNWI